MSNDQTDASTAGPAGRRSFVIPSLAAAIVVSITCSLGAWQYGRGQQKEAMAAQRQRAEQAVPLQYRSLKMLQGLEDLEQKRVVLVGEFLPGRILLDQRLHQGRWGAHVLSPFALVDGGVVLVNRGWMPKPVQAGQPWPDTPVRKPGADAGSRPSWLNGIVTLRLDRRMELSQDPNVLRQGEVWQNLDLAAASGYFKSPLAPWVVLQTEGDDTLVRQWQSPQQVDPSKHYGYAFQWFALASVTLGLWAFFGRKHWRARRLITRQGQG